MLAKVLVQSRPRIQRLSRSFMHPQKGVQLVLGSVRFRQSFLSDQDFLDNSNNHKNAVFVPVKTAVAKPPSVQGSGSTATTILPFQHIRLGVQLSKYGLNLTKLASEGKLERVIGREEELQQAIQILSRRRKNNPCLIGEAGVGKTSIAEGLATMIYEGNVPASMVGKSIISLDLPSMLAGTKFRGEFEDRMKGVMKEIEQAGDKIILFIDEIHVMVGAGGSEGAIDASNILKPSLARGKLRCLGATTSDEYAKYIEKDPALARRFQSVYVKEPTAEHTVEILKGIRDKYESHHSVLIPDDALKCAVYLSGRYQTARKYPDKAIDLIDESASRVRNRRERKPIVLDTLERDLHSLLGELSVESVAESSSSMSSSSTSSGSVVEAGTSSTSSNDSSSSSSNTNTIDTLSSLRDQLQSNWQQKNAILHQLFEARKEYDSCVAQMKQLRRQALPDKDDFLKKRIQQKDEEIQSQCRTLIALVESDATLTSSTSGSSTTGSSTRNLETPAVAGDEAGSSSSSSSSSSDGGGGGGGGGGDILSAELELSREEWVHLAMGEVQNVVTEEELAAVVGQSTGIPVSTMLGDNEKQKLLHMEDALKEGLVGQDEAIASIARCIRLSRAGLRYHERPLGVFLMIGPTGTGKTELAKALSEFLFQDPLNSLLRIDMSEYMERFSVSRLIGAPPGYVGFEEGGALTESIRRRPYQVILLDEFEKAHREVSNLLLQVFDEGRLSDSHGTAVDFRNTVIIMTSNLGSDLLNNLQQEQDELKKKQQQQPRGRGESTNSSDSDTTGTIMTEGELRQKKREIATKLVHTQFSPEFVNRLDEVIVFNPLTTQAMQRICELQLRKVGDLLATRGSNTLGVTPEAVAELTRAGTDLQYGARPMKRLIQNALLNPLATYILQEKVSAGDYVLITTTEQATKVRTTMEALAGAGGSSSSSSSTAEDVPDLTFILERGSSSSSSEGMESSSSSGGVDGGSGADHDHQYQFQYPDAPSDILLLAEAAELQKLVVLEDPLTASSATTISSSSSDASSDASSNSSGKHEPQIVLFVWKPPSPSSSLSAPEDER